VRLMKKSVKDSDPRIKGSLIVVLEQRKISTRVKMLAGREKREKKRTGGHSPREGLGKRPTLKGKKKFHSIEWRAKVRRRKCIKNMNLHSVLGAVRVKTLKKPRPKALEKAGA